MEIKKIFSNEKCLNTPFLNILGYQSFRYFFAKFIFLLKYKFNNIDKNSYNYLQHFFDNGYQVEENLLPEAEFAELKKEALLAIKNQETNIKENDEKNISENGLNYVILNIDEKIKNLYPRLYNFKHNNFIKNFFSTCEQVKDYHLYCRVEKVEVLDGDHTDSNKEYHYDTFHNTFKCWLFINKVELEDGPFRYVKSSHNFSIKRFFFEWLQSITFSLKKNIDPSFRVNKKLKDKLDNNAICMTVNENTLVMANTHGLHRRGDAKKGRMRIAIQFWTRENPFKILFN